MMRISLTVAASLLLLATVTATSPEEPTPSTENWIEGPLGRIGFEVASDHILIEPTTMQQNHSLDVLLFIGNETDTYPQEWYVFHFGNVTVATDFEGDTLDMQVRGTAWSVDRDGGAAGDCIKVMAQQWQRIDAQKQVTGTAPEGAAPMTAWDDLPCHEQDGQRASAPEPPGDKGSPGIAVVAVLAVLGVAAWVRRP